MPKPFKNHRGIAVPLDLSNVDTDQIIPKQFLKSIKRTGFGEALFFDWRYLADGSPNPDFVINRPEYKGATILIAGNNFGCGSSREHAVWAIQQYGFQAVIAPSRKQGSEIIPAFADIFRNNSLKNALLTIELDEAEVKRILACFPSSKPVEISVDLETQKVTVYGPSEMVFPFSIDSGIRKRILEGLDDIGLTLKSETDIADFEKNHSDQLRRFAA